MGGPDEVTVTVRAPWPRADRRPVVLSVEGMCPDEVTVSVRALWPWSVLRGRVGCVVELILISKRHDITLIFLRAIWSMMHFLDHAHDLHMCDVTSDDHV